jgi:signal transduction histidine kinase
MANAGDAGRFVNLRFKPLNLYADAVREFCSSFARATFEEPGLGERVRLVVHELVENAIKYGDDELELRIECSDADVVIRVTNTASEARSKSLRQTFEALMRIPAHEAYAEALRAAASLPHTEAKVGLSRIRYEGQVDLHLDLSPGKVSVTARGTAA